MDSGSKIFVRNDLSKEERHTESLLLKRGELSSGKVLISHIQIKGLQLFVNVSSNCIPEVGD